MPHLKFSRTAPFAPDQMLDLVSDLRAYPDFVPNCSSMHLERDAGWGKGEKYGCDARMHVRFGPISRSYTSQVRVDRNKGTITARALDGPFSHLDSQWTFLPDETGKGTHVTFEIDFAFSNPLVAAVAEPAFSSMQEQILNAFVAEAQRRYS